MRLHLSDLVSSCVLMSLKYWALGGIRLLAQISWKRIVWLVSFQISPGGWPGLRFGFRVLTGLFGSIFF